MKETASLAGSFARATRDHLERLREGERRVREDGDLEGVHLMRTSCRRLRAAVKYLGDPLPREGRKSLQRHLRDAMAALSRVRDLDVLRQAIETVPGLAPSEAEDLREGIDQRLSEETLRMQRALDGDEYAGLLKLLEKAADAPDDGTPVTRVGPERISAAWAETMGLKPADWAVAPEETFHGLRKSVKRIRYTLEAFAPAYGRPVAKAIERCRDLQESLGVIQDASAFAELLKGIRSFSAGQFLATVRARAAGEVDRLGDLWEKAFGPKAAGRLGAHLFRRAAWSEAAREAVVERRRAV